MSDIGQVDPEKYSRLGCTEVFLKYIALPVGAYLGGNLFTESFYEHMGPITGTVFSSALLALTGILIPQREKLRTITGSVLPFFAGIVGPERTNEVILGIQSASYFAGFVIGAFTNLLSKYRKE